MDNSQVPGSLQLKRCHPYCRTLQFEDMETEREREENMKRKKKNLKVCIYWLCVLRYQYQSLIAIHNPLTAQANFAV